MKTCGECEVCCTLMGVKEIGKLAGQECLHVTSGKGCAIYSERPESCRTFECLWKLSTSGILTEKDRPDKCGVMLAPAGDHSAFSKGTGISPIIMFEAAPGAFKRYHGDRLVNRLKKKVVLILVPYGSKEQDRKLVGPPLAMRKAKEWLTKQFK